MASLHDRYGRPLGATPRRRRRRIPDPPRATAPGAPRNPHQASGREQFEVHDEGFAHDDGFAGIPPHGGGGTVIVEQAPAKKERGTWIKTIAIGALSAVGAIVAYRAYEAFSGKKAPSPNGATENPAPPTQVTYGGFAMPSPQSAQAAALLAQPSSANVTNAMALQALASLQAQQALAAQPPPPAPVQNPAEEEDEEASYMDQYLAELDEELEE